VFEEPPLVGVGSAGSEAEAISGRQVLNVSHTMPRTVIQRWNLAL